MLIVHRCQGCGCPDLWALEALYGALVAAGYPRQGIPANSIPPNLLRRGCRHQLHNGGAEAHHPGKRCTYGPPELIKEWDARTGQLIEEIQPPGPPVGQLRRLIRTCDCDACRKLYAELTGVRA